MLSVKLADIGLSTAQYEVLSCLQRAPGITQQELAERCFVAKSGISMLLKRMEQDRWVRRTADKADARVKRLNLTGRGFEQARRALQIQSEVVAAMASSLSRDELIAVDGIMRRISLDLLKLCSP